jgi:hypothetical protein
MTSYWIFIFPPLPVHTQLSLVIIISKPLHPNSSTLNHMSTNSIWVICEYNIYLRNHATNSKIYRSWKINSTFKHHICTPILDWGFIKRIVIDILRINRNNQTAFIECVSNNPNGDVLRVSINKLEACIVYYVLEFNVIDASITYMHWFTNHKFNVNSLLIHSSLYKCYPYKYYSLLSKTNVMLH